MVIIWSFLENPLFNSGFFCIKIHYLPNKNFSDIALIYLTISILIWSGWNTT